MSHALILEIEQEVENKAVRLRLTNQSRWTPEKSGTAARHKSKLEVKPWEI